jgi:VanZ family protein
MSAIRLLVNILYAVLLMAGGLVTLPVGSGGGIPDVVLHGTAYGLQAALLFWLFSSTMRPRGAIVAAVFCATLFGAMVEILQLFRPMRELELKDLFANTVGACIVGVVIDLAGRSRS